jgi:hypothetical protein
MPSHTWTTRKHIVLLTLMLCTTARTTAAELSFKRIEIDAQPPKNPWVKLAGDFNQDGKLDIAIGGSKGPLVWYVNPTWQKVTVAPGGYQTVAGAVGDVDGDGDMDLVPGMQVWFENPLPQGDPERDLWKRHIISNIRSHDALLADLDGDKRPDIVARDQSGFGHKTGNLIHFWQQQAPDTWQHHTIPCPHGEGLALADLDRDGDPDVVTGGIWYENDGQVNGTWRKHPYTTAWTWADTKVGVGDLNRDGRLDVALAPAEFKNQMYRLAWYQAPIDTKVSAWVEHVVDVPVEAVTHGVAIADMNGDRQADIVCARMHQGAAPQEISVYLNRGKGAQWQKIVVSERGSHDVLVADFNGDGRLDILGANHGGGYCPVEVWLNLGER